MILKYRKKPVVIEAVIWTGDNQQELHDFIKGFLVFKNTNLIIHTLEGNMIANVGDYIIIKDVNGEFYPCKPGIFEKAYELAD